MMLLSQQDKFPLSKLAPIMQMKFEEFISQMVIGVTCIKEMIYKISIKKKITSFLQ